MKDATYCRSLSPRDHSRKRKRSPPRDRGTRRTADDANKNVTRPRPEHGSHHASKDVVSHARRHTEESQIASLSLGRRGDVADSPLRLPPAITHLASDSSSIGGKPGNTVETLCDMRLSKTPHANERHGLPPKPLSLPAPTGTLRLPTSPAGSAPDLPSTTSHRYQVNLVFQGHPFSYDLSTLPDDPSSTITLLTLTDSDPGAYLLVGAHYRRTGRPKAACRVLRALLASQDSASNPEKDNTHGLFRAVYGTVNEAIIAGADRPRSRSARDIEFSSNRRSSSSPSSQLLAKRSNVPASILPDSSQLSARIQALERELNEAREMQKRLRGKLTNSDDRLGRAEKRIQSLEFRYQDVLHELNDAEEKNRELRRRLTEAEHRAKELENGANGAETRVWKRLRDVLFDQSEGDRRAHYILSPSHL
ncbi:hypothetical protein BU15DRAFT_68811 [Melanogaster broomeanus]|nr:hypothetical protein BU15DRAFT_68811 [Melanogaster broomeanus]